MVKAVVGVHSVGSFGKGPQGRHKELKKEIYVCLYVSVWLWVYVTAC